MEEKTVGNNKIYFVVMPIEASVKEMNISPMEMYRRLERVNLLKRLVLDCFDDTIRWFYVFHWASFGQYWTYQFRFSKKNLFDIFIYPSRRVTRSYAINTRIGHNLVEYLLVWGRRGVCNNSYYYLSFDSYNRQWLDFIISNRNGKEP